MGLYLFALTVPPSCHGALMTTSRITSGGESSKENGSGGGDGLVIQPPYPNPSFRQTNCTDYDVQTRPPDKGDIRTLGEHPGF